MVGAVAMVVVLVVVLPVLFLFGGAILAGVLGTSLTSDAETTHAGSELVDLSR